MKTTAIHCDRCKKPIVSGFWASIRWEHQNRGPTVSVYDLCEPCATLVESVIKDRAASTGGPPPG